MIQVIKNKEGTNIKELVCDKKTDMADIDLRVCGMGSTCFVIDEDKNYMLNSDKKWKEVNLTGASGGGNGVTWISKRIRAGDDNTTLTVELDNPLPEEFHMVGYGLYGDYTTKDIICFSNDNNGNSFGIVMDGFVTSTTPPSVGLTGMGFTFTVSADRKTVQIKAAAPGYVFITNQTYVVFIAY